MTTNTRPAQRAEVTFGAAGMDTAELASARLATARTAVA
jgi:hypothetical protein